MTVAPPRSYDRSYDRSDWASAFVNVEQELTDVALSPVKGTVPAELAGRSLASALISATAATRRTTLTT